MIEGVEVSGRRLPKSYAPWIVVGLGIVVFVLVAASIRWWDRENEQRLLQEKTDQAGVVLTVSVNQYLDPIASMAQVAELADGDPALFEAMAAELQSEDASPYARIALLDIDDGAVDIVAGGTIASLRLDDAGRRDVVARATPRSIQVVDLLAADRTLGFAVSGPTGQMLVYIERELSLDPNIRRRQDGPFGNVDYAIYLGDTADETRLLGASARSTPLTGTVASTSVEYGDTTLLLVASPIERLGSPLLGRLWWIVLLAGLAVTATTGALLLGLHRSRSRAVELAADNARQHREQRDIAETLQLELLPQRLVHPPGVQLATRYWVADTASLIGGDFYDSFQIDAGRWGILIGDVCGKGTTAAALTGLVRHTVRTASRFIDSPAEVLRAVHAAMAEHEPSTFCTAALMFYSPHDSDGSSGGRLVASLGGHPPPMHRSGEHVGPIGRPGTLLGMLEPRLSDEVVELRPGDVVVAYTDGLTDAPGGRGLSWDDLASVVASADDIEHIAAELRHRRGLRPGAMTDDTALLLLTVRETRSEGATSRSDPTAIAAT